MRRQRISTSCSVLSSAWPMCRLPVTLGGGMTMQYGALAESGCAFNAPEGSHSGWRGALIALGSQVLSSISCLIDETPPSTKTPRLAPWRWMSQGRLGLSAGQPDDLAFDIAFDHRRQV